MSDNIFERLNQMRFGQGGAQNGPGVGGALGFLPVVGGLNLSDTNGLLSDTQGIAGKNIITMSSRKGERMFDKLLKGMHEDLKNAGANIRIGGDNLVAPLSTPGMPAGRGAPIFGRN